MTTTTQHLTAPGGTVVAVRDTTGQWWSTTARRPITQVEALSLVGIRSAR